MLHFQNRIYADIYIAIRSAHFSIRILYRISTDDVRKCHGPIAILRRTEPRTQSMLCDYCATTLRGVRKLIFCAYTDAITVGLPRGTVWLAALLRPYGY